MDIIEKQLVSGLKRRDQESYRVLFERYGAKIYNLAYKMCGNQDDADDIVQGTFIQVFRNIDVFREESGVYTWLYTIAKNLCLRLLENRKKSTVSSLDTLIHTVPTQENEYSAIEKQYYINQVKEGCLLGLLLCLSFYQRIAFILYTLLEMRVKDIAVIIDKSETAIRTLIHRARQNIRGFLCRNCHYYDPDNPCRCENLIDFSLKQGWIKKMTDSVPHPPITALEIETEIRELKKISVIYHSLPEHQPPDDIILSIREKIARQEYRILNHKKVK